jgi:GNAT superfamily N-acetyltransferase
MTARSEASDARAAADWRSMQPADIAAVHALSCRVHADYPERAAVLAEKLTLFPAGCFVLGAGARILGYAVSHPWTKGAPPALDTLLGALPAAPTTCFIHDVTLDEDARGRGHAAAILPQLIGAAHGRGLRHMMLVAVNGAEALWARLGFGAIDDAARQAAARATYGPRAVLMERDV